MTTQRQYIPLGGGIDTETPILSVPPGCVREAWNFEQSVDGGYQRVKGYERFDGHPEPHLATYQILPVTLVTAAVPGDAIQGATSGAVAYVLNARSGELDLAEVTGTFTAGETLLVHGLSIGNASGPAVTGTDPDALADAADIRRALIQPVPGSGPVRGVAKFKDVVYAFRDVAGGATKKMYRATDFGWSEVSTPTLNGGGLLEAVIHNFGTGEVLYGADGANNAFAFDGTTFVQIHTGAPDDRPKHVAAHQNHLFLSFGHSVIHSSLGTPLVFDATTGAAEIAVGATVTNMVPQPGSQGSGALAISTDNTLHVLYGTSAANWSLIPLQSEMGALSGTMQNVGVAFMLNQRGITIIGQSQEYGNFAHSVVSHKAATLLNQLTPAITASAVHRQKNQYRLFFGKRALFVTVSGRKVAGILPVEFAHPVECCTTTFDDEFYFGSDDGYVYRGEAGSSFDGAAIDSLLVFPFNSNKSLRLRKRYRRLLVEMTSESPVTMTANFSLAYGDYDVSPLEQRGFASSEWDSASWDIDTWDGGTGPIARVDLEGSGENISVALNHSSRSVAPFVLRSFILEFSPRRGER